VRRSEESFQMFYADTVQVVAQSGFGLGSILAVTCSWHRNRSLLLAIIAGFLSWFYVLWFALTRRPGE
jgi:hypothetical protein